jgi:hypothetical protein
MTREEQVKEWEEAVLIERTLVNTALKVDHLDAVIMHDGQRYILDHVDKSGWVSAHKIHNGIERKRCWYGLDVSDWNSIMMQLGVPRHPYFAQFQTEIIFGSSTHFELVKLACTVNQGWAT